MTLAAPWVPLSAALQAAPSSRLCALASADPPKIRMMGIPFGRVGEGMHVPIPAAFFLAEGVAAHANGTLTRPRGAVGVVAGGLSFQHGDAWEWANVVVNHADLLAAFPPRRPGRPDPAELAKRMLAMQQGATPRMKRDAAIRKLREDAGCTAREALAAWNALPSDLRGTRGNRPV